MAMVTEYNFSLERQLLDQVNREQSELRARDPEFARFEQRNSEKLANLLRGIPIMLVNLANKADTAELLNRRLLGGYDITIKPVQEGVLGLRFAINLFTVEDSDDDQSLDNISKDEIASELIKAHMILPAQIKRYVMNNYENIEPRLGKNYMYTLQENHGPMQLPIVKMLAPPRPLPKSGVICNAILTPCGSIRNNK